MYGGHTQHSGHIDRGVADRHDRIKGGNLCGEAFEIVGVIDCSVIDHASTKELRHREKKQLAGRNLRSLSGAMHREVLLAAPRGELNRVPQRQHAQMRT
jgi:hypothetical protein